MTPLHLMLRVALRTYAPLLTLFALSLLASWPENSGAGFVAGAVLGLVFVLHAMLFGAHALAAAFPPALARLLLCAAVVAAMAAAGLPGLPMSGKAVEGALFFVTAAGAALVVMALTGRAPALRDEDW
jgi:hypothetical protein